MKQSFISVIAAMLLMAVVPCQAKPEPIIPPGAELNWNTLTDFRQSRLIDDVKAKELQEQLNKNPDNLEIRAKLVVYYANAVWKNPQLRAEKNRNILWLIAHYPGLDYVGMPYLNMHPGLDPQDFTKGAELWEQQVKKYPDHAVVAANAASYFLHADPKKSEQYWQQACRLAPDNVQFVNNLGHFYLLQLQRNYLNKSSQELAQKAYQEFSKAYRLSNPEERKAGLPKYAIAAYFAGNYAAARSIAEEMLKEDPAGKSWNTGNLLFHGNMILGLLAAQEQQWPLAADYLRKSAMTPGSPQLNSFGPNCLLAQKLLEHGDRQAVIDYFKLCAKFWKMGAQRLKDWTRDVEAGKIPDFQANLFY